MTFGLAFDIAALLMILIVSRQIALWLPVKNRGVRVLLWLIVGLPVAIVLTSILILSLIWITGSKDIPGLPPQVRALFETGKRTGVVQGKQVPTSGNQQQATSPKYPVTEVNLKSSGGVTALKLTDDIICSDGVSLTATLTYSHFTPRDPVCGLIWLRPVSEPGWRNDHRVVLTSDGTQHSPTPEFDGKGTRQAVSITLSSQEMEALTTAAKAHMKVGQWEYVLTAVDQAKIGSVLAAWREKTSSQ